jgi:hypothetical protein
MRSAGRGPIVTGDEVARVAHGSDSLDTHGEAHEHEEVTSPDQHRRTVSPRLARLGAILVIIVLPLMAFIGNHQGGVEKIFLVGISAFLLLMLIIDFFLRRAGLRT